MLSDGSDEIFTEKVLDEGASHGSSNLELFGEDCSGDAEDLGDLLEHSLILLVLEEDGVVKLLLYLDLGPGLLLSLGRLSSLLF